MMDCLRMDDNALIYHGEALTVTRLMADSSVDAVITDPPYSTGGISLASKQASPRTKYQNHKTRKTYPAMLGDTRDQRSYVLWATLWLSECWRVTRDGCPLLVFTDWRQLPALTDAVQAAGWLWRGVLVWHKPSARPVLGEFRRDAEFIVYGTKGKPGIQSRRCFPGVIKCPINTAAKRHITGKPLPLLQELMVIVKPGGLVFDPFVGGGTTAEAALSTGRRFIGGDLSRDYTIVTGDRLLEMDTSK